MKTVLSMAALAALLCCSATTARAQDADDAEVTRMAKEHYKQGLEAYKSGHYDVAIKELKKAYLLKRLPALLLNIGATYRKMGELDQSIHYYQKYLDEAPAEAKDRPEVQKTIAEVQAEKAAPPPAQGNQETTAPPSEHPVQHNETPPVVKQEHAAPMPSEWSHSVIDAAPPDSPIDVRVSMPVMKGVKVFVFYRTTGQATFAQVLMKRRGPEKVGRIPGEAVEGKAIQYYIEARDASGAVVKSSGSESNPNVVMIDPNAKPMVLASIDSHESGETAAHPTEEGQPAARNLDDESAPMSGQVKEPKKTGTIKKKVAVSSSGGTRQGGFSTLFWAGVGVGAVGVVGLVVGAVGLAQAKSYADQVAASSQNPIDSNGQKIFFNNDPIAMMGGFAQQSSLESQGKMWNTVGIALTTVGAIATVAGVVIIVIDLMSSKKPVERPRARATEVSRWYVSPVAGPQQSGVVAGFSF